MTDATATRFEVKVDTLLAAISDLSFRCERRLDKATDRLHVSAGDSREYKTRTKFVWKRTTEDCLANPRPNQPVYMANAHAADAAEYTAARELLHEVNETFNSASEHYTGWARFFLVANVDGHIHSSTHCSTCHWSTRFLWLPTLSGLTEADAVAEHGPRLCSVCFPSAPVEWTLGIPANVSKYCAGSDKASKAGGRARYAACPDCGKTVAITKYGMIRKHAPGKVRAAASA